MVKRSLNLSWTISYPFSQPPVGLFMRWGTTRRTELRSDWIISQR